MKTLFTPTEIIRALPSAMVFVRVVFGFIPIRPFIFMVKAFNYPTDL